MTDTPLNPDALQAGLDAGHIAYSIGGDQDDVSRAAITGYILAVAQPEVNSVEELEALPNGSVIRAKNSWIWEVQRVGDFITTGMNSPVSADKIRLPARVLYRPEVNDA